MSVHIVAMTDTEAATVAAHDPDAGLGALHSERGNLPLERLDVQVAISGLVARTELTQGFHNPHPVPLEATYIFPLPDRAAVTAMRMTAAGRVVQAELKERGAAREEYDEAIAQGHRASIAEQERADVFTMRVGNILPGERVEVALTLVGPLPYEDGEATLRFPLVVAPRYVPGDPLPGGAVGDGYAMDTDAVPDASRITPPVLLPGFPNPVRLSIEVDIDPAGLPLGEVRSSLHAVSSEGGHVSIQPGERANRDFVLRLGYGDPDATVAALALAADATGDEGTFQLTVLPPVSQSPPKPRDVVLVLDRSGSMGGWKMVAARRAAARIVDTLTSADRFAVLTFDHVVESPPSLNHGLVAATDRHRFRAVEHLARVEARGGTEMLAPLTQALGLLGTAAEGARDRVLLLVTDGQVGNEDQILAAITPGLAGVRVHTVGIDQAVNAGFLGRLAAAGAGRCELVESEDRLDHAMDRIHRRIAAPVVTGLSVTPDGLDIIAGSLSPARRPDLFAGAPLVVTGRYRASSAQASAGPGVRVDATARDGTPWSGSAAGAAAADVSLAAVWARAHLRDLEDVYAAGGYAAAGADSHSWEQRIVATSLRFGVLCRFTAWLAVDTRVAADGGVLHRVVQPVEPAAGWDMLAPPMPMMAAAMPAPAAASGGFLARATFARRAPTVGRTAAAPGQPAQSLMSASGPAPAAPVEQVAAGRADLAADELATARAAIAEEARRLREAPDVPEVQRWEILADLGSRLAAVVRHLSACGVDAALLAPLRDLATDCEAERPSPVPAGLLVRLWARALQVLDEFAA